MLSPLEKTQNIHCFDVLWIYLTIAFSVALYRGNLNIIWNMGNQMQCWQVVHERRDENRIVGCKFDRLQTTGWQQAEQLLFRDLVISNSRRSLVILKKLTFKFNLILSITSFSALLHVRISFPQCNFSLCAELYVDLFPLLNSLSFARCEERLGKTRLSNMTGSMFSE